MSTVAAYEIPRLRNLKVKDVVLAPDRATDLVVQDPWDEDFVGGTAGNDLRIAEIEELFRSKAESDEWEKDEVLVAHAMHLAGVYIKNYKLDKAEGMLDAVTAWCEGMPGPFHWKFLQKLATLRYKQSRQEECAELLEKLAEVAPPSPVNHSNLTTAYNSLGQYEKAMSHVEKSIALKGRAEKDDKWAMGLVKKNLGCSEEALKYLKEALQEYYDDSSDEVMLAKLHDSVADAMKKCGDMQGAMTHYRKAHELFEKTVGEMSPLTGTAASLLGKLLMEQGQFKEARKLLIQALHIEGTKDAAHCTPMYELVCLILKLHMDCPVPAAELGSIAELRPILLASVENMDQRNQLNDGNGGVLMHKMAEILLFGSPGFAPDAAPLLERAKALLQAEKKFDMGSVLSIIELELDTARSHIKKAAEKGEGNPASPSQVASPPPASGAEKVAPKPVRASEPPAATVRKAQENGKSNGKDNTIRSLREENEQLRAENEKLKSILKRVKDGFRALDEL